MNKTNKGSYNSVVSNLLIRTPAKVKRGVWYSTGNCRFQEENKRQSWKIQASPVRKKVGYLSTDNLHKMIRRFLVEKQMSKEELASVLEITVRNLEQLFSPEIPPGLLCKVNFPLVSLYCSTKWD